MDLSSFGFLFELYTYWLFNCLGPAIAEDGKFLLAARKCRRPTCTDYIISLHADEMSKGSSTYIGKLRCALGDTGIDFFCCTCAP